MNQKPERWSKSVIVPDMWLDPDQDPREAGDDPAGERATCVRYLRDYRLTIELKCQGLDAAQMASRPVPPSMLSLLALLRHLGEVERDWRNWITAVSLPAGSTGRRDPTSRRCARIPPRYPRRCASCMKSKMPPTACWPASKTSASAQDASR